MKFLGAVALLTLSSVSFAAERAIYDLQYLPTSGTNYGMTEAAWTSGSASGDQFDIDLNGYFIKQTFGHAFTDQFSLEASIDYSNLKQEIEFDDSLGVDDREQDQTGLGDIDISGRFRLIDEELRLDLIGGATLSTGDSEVESNGDMNNKVGGNVLRIGAEVGQKRDSFQWSILGKFQRHFEAKTEIADGTEVEDDAHNSWIFEASTLNRLAERSFLKSTVGVKFEDEYEDDDNNTTAADTHILLELEYQHLLSQDLLLKAGVIYNTHNTGAYDKFHYGVVTVGARYQF